MTELELRKEWDESSHDLYAQMKYFTKGEILPPKFYSYIDDYMNSHEWWKLKKAIIEKYEDIIIEIENNEESLDLILKEDISDPYFDALVEHYNYRYTKDRTTYHIESVYYEKVTDDEFEALSCSVGYIFIPKDKYVKSEDSSIYIRNEYDLYSKIHICAIDGNLYFNRKYVDKFIQELYGKEYNLYNVEIIKIDFKDEYNPLYYNPYRNNPLYYKFYREIGINNPRHLVLMSNIYKRNMYHISFNTEEECRKEYNEYYDETDLYQMDYFFNSNIPKQYIIKLPNIYEKICYHSSYKYLVDYINSHNFDELKYQITLKFQDDIKEIRHYSDSFDLILNKLINDPYFDALVEHYNFRYIKDGLTYHIEPIKYIDYSYEFENISASKGYIFIPNEEIDNILENGIFIRNKYGLFSKIHIYASYRHIKYEIDNLNKFIQNLYGQNYNLSNIGIIKVNLRDLNVYVCHEADDTDPRHVITAINIDKQRMEKIDLERYEKTK